MFNTLDRIIILDGATGTELQKRGLPSGACPEKWVLEHPEAIKEVQRNYADAGSDFVYAPTFGANRINLKNHGITESVSSICRSLVSISRDAVPDHVLVGGDISSTGLQLFPFGTATYDEIVDVYREQAEALEEAGVDFYGIETQISLYEARAALTAVKQVSKKPVLVTFSCNSSGRSIMGANLISALLCAQDMGADAFGINCCGDLGLVSRLLGEINEYSRIPLIAKPNAGLPITENGKIRYAMTPEQFVAAVPDFVNSGAAMIGGCCGTNKAHIAALSAAVKGLKPLPHNPVKTSAAASQTAVVDVTESTCMAEIPVDDDLTENMAEAMAEGAELLRLHIRDEDDIDCVDSCQYALTMPLAVSFESDELKEKFLYVYHGKPYIL